jgi:hypothetical protein
MTTSPFNSVEQLLIDDSAPTMSAQTKQHHHALLHAATVSAPQMAAAPTRPTSVRRRGVTLGLAAAGLALAGGGVAVAVLATQQPTDADIVRCFAVATTAVDDPTLSIDGAWATEPDGTGPSSAARAELICTSLWERGELAATPPHVRPDSAGTARPVPPLQACVLPSGIVGVFPGGSDTCTSLRLPAADM